MQDDNNPVQTFHSGNVTAKIIKGRLRHIVTFHRFHGYKDAETESILFVGIEHWNHRIPLVPHNTNEFFADDLSDLLKVAMQAYAWIQNNEPGTAIISKEGVK